MICDPEPRGPDALIPIRMDGRFRIKELLGSGTYGYVYRAVNIFTNTSYAIKLELSTNRSSSVEHEYKILKSLGGGDGIPCIHWFGREANYDVLVLEHLGPSLHKLMSNRQIFHLHTVVHIADQLISRLQTIHDHGFIHADIKPQNVLVGLGDNAHTIHIIDFGVAKRYRDLVTGSHIPFVHARRLTGTPAFTSVSSHLGVQLGRRDDVESLAYLLIYLLRGSLPWFGTETLSAILELKKKTPVEQLCHRLPREFATFFTYSRSLSFTEEPDYDYLRSLLLPLRSPQVASDSLVIMHNLSASLHADRSRDVSSASFPPSPPHRPMTDLVASPLPKIVQAPAPIHIVPSMTAKGKQSPAKAPIPRKVIPPSQRILRSSRRDSRHPGSISVIPVI